MEECVLLQSMAQLYTIQTDWLSKCYVMLQLPLSGEINSLIFHLIETFQPYSLVSSNKSPPLDARLHSNEIKHMPLVFMIPRSNFPAE
jgi:hypothetical protein